MDLTCLAACLRRAEHESSRYYKDQNVSAGSWRDDIYWETRENIYNLIRQEVIRTEKIGLAKRFGEFLSLTNEWEYRFMEESEAIQKSEKYWGEVASPILIVNEVLRS